MKEFKYRTYYYSALKTVPNEDKDKYLARASLDNLKKLIPQIDISRNFDLLPIGFEAFNANKFNKNDDGISGETAIKFYKSLILKYLNANHKRDRIFGVVVSSFLTDYITSAEITEEDALKLKKPFNISNGAVFWKVVNETLADMLEESGNPESEYYGRIFTSFEIGFDQYNIWKIQGESKNFEDGIKVTDLEEFKKLDPILRANGGSGKSDNYYIYREIIGDGVVGLGMALVENPAGYLKPIATLTSQDSEKKPIFDTISADIKETVIKTLKEQQKDGGLLQTDASKQDESKKNEDFSSQLKNNNVNIINNNNMPKKFAKIEEITDESLKEATASTITEFVQLEIEKASKQFVEERKAKEDVVKNLNETKAELEIVKKQLKEIQDQASAKEAQDKFNARMVSFDESYELEVDDRKILAEDLRGLTDEAFASFEKKMAVLLKNKSKAFIKAQKDAAEAEIEKKKKEAQASTNNNVDKALENAEKDKNKIPNTPSTEVDPKAKYTKAFSLEEGFIFNKNQRAKHSNVITV